MNEEKMEGVKQKIMQSFVSTRIELTQKKGKKMTLSPKLNTLRIEYDKKWMLNVANAELF